MVRWSLDRLFLFIILCVGTQTYVCMCLCVCLMLRWLPNSILSFWEEKNCEVPSVELFVLFCFVCQFFQWNSGFKDHENNEEQLMQQWIVVVITVIFAQWLLTESSHGSWVNTKVCLLWLPGAGNNNEYHQAWPLLYFLQPRMASDSQHAPYLTLPGSASSYVYHHALRILLFNIIF